MNGRIAVVALVLAACGNTESKGPPDAREVHVPSPPPAAVDPCRRSIEALTEAMRGVAAASQPLRGFTSEPWFPGLACAELYREPACGAAWKAGIVPPGNAPAIYDACRKVYCPKLKGECPAEKKAGETPTLENLVALDAKILALEGVDPFAIRVFAERARLFRVVTVAVAAPTSQPALGPTLTIVVDAQGGVSVEGKKLAKAALGAKLAELAAAKGQLVFQADPKTPHGTIVELMDQAKQAGVSRMAISTSGTDTH